VRTLVFRGWAGADSLDLLTDGRSAKSTELRQEPKVELCWLLPKARSQFRLRGRRLELSPEANLAARSQHWEQLNPGARALWGWPEPGAAFESDGLFPAELADGTPLPVCFELVRIQVEQVELLELTGHPHQRRRWRADGGWLEQRLNP
jgi:pyridoxamine 5'-phosphate oxidase